MKKLTIQLNIVPAPTTELLQCFGLPIFRFQSGSQNTGYCFFKKFQSDSISLSLYFI